MCATYPTILIYDDVCPKTPLVSDTTPACAIFFCATEIFMIKYFGASKGKCYTVISLYNSSIDPITAEPSYCSSSGVSSVFPFGYMLPNSITCDVSNSEILLGTNSFNLDDHDDIYYRCTHNCAIFA